MMVSLGAGGKSYPSPRKHPSPVLQRQLTIRILILDRVPCPAHRPVGSGRDGFQTAGSGASQDDEQGRSRLKFWANHNWNI